MSPVSIKFQSTPDLVNRENPKQLAETLRAKLFQSTPDLVNRENAGAAYLSQMLTSFNPLPI